MSKPHFVLLKHTYHAHTSLVYINFLSRKNSQIQISNKQLTQKHQTQKYILTETYKKEKKQKKKKSYNLIGKNGETDEFR